MFLNYLEKKFNKQMVKSKPWKFFIEVSLSCNLRCITCGHNTSNFGGIMKDEIFEGIKPILSSAKVIHEVGYGEPLIDKNFLDKLKYFKELNAFVDIYTNGMLLNKILSEQLVSMQLDQITFSIDGGTKKTFESIRIGASYLKVLENIKELHQIKIQNGRDKPFMRANYVGMARNIEELPLAIKTLAEIGIKEVILSDMFPTSSELAQECLYYYKDVTSQSIQKSKETARQYRVNLISPSVYNEPKCHDNKLSGLIVSDSQDENGVFNFILNNNDKPCPRRADEKNESEYTDLNNFPCFEPWQTLYITYDGNVRPCCVIGESFGNLMNESIDKIWNSEKYQLLRKSVNTQRPAFEACKHCLLRRRVRFSFRNAAALCYRSVINNGFFHTAKKTIKYLSEYY